MSATRDEIERLRAQIRLSQFVVLPGLFLLVCACLVAAHYVPGQDKPLTIVAVLLVIVEALVSRQVYESYGRIRSLETIARMLEWEVGDDVQGEER